MVHESMKTELIDKISDIVTPFLQPAGAFLVSVNIRGERASSIVEIFADTDEGITADQCAAISRSVSQELDKENIIPGRYKLEVSSPGLDRPLLLPRQLKKNTGRQVKIISRASNPASEATGILQEVTDTFLTLLTSDKHTISIPFADISEAIVLPRFK